MYGFCYRTLKPHWHEKVLLHYMDTDSFVLSFDTDDASLVDFLKKKDESDSGELPKNRELFDSFIKKLKVK